VKAASTVAMQAAAISHPVARVVLQIAAAVSAMVQ